MNRHYYSNSIYGFICEANESILGKLTENHEFNLEEQQRNSWRSQIGLLKTWLEGLSGHIIFEYSIPRLGKRIDCVIISKSTLFVIEFKVGESEFKKSHIDQVFDYALDLKYFHKESHEISIIPILICTEAEIKDCEENLLQTGTDKVFEPICTNGKNLSQLLETFERASVENAICIESWIDSEYHPTPTIIEAARALYRGHSVENISRSDADVFNLSRTSEAIFEVIENCKKNSCKAICFLTGVPGAGKTLAGLNLANGSVQSEGPENAVFLSGNGPLVAVLREALTIDDVEQNSLNGKKTRKKSSEQKTHAFIQNIHHFRDDGIKSSKPPFEQVVIFDEAQRAWTCEQTASFMKRKKGIVDFQQSEPEFLIGYMDRHETWATIVCLVGEGQEINRGEAGIKEWFSALKRSFPHWSVFVSDKLREDIDTENLNIRYNEALHLSVSARSFRSEKVSEFVRAMLDLDRETAKELYQELTQKYPIVLTRDLQNAKEWIKQNARGSERYGILASSGGIRLRPEGINVKAKIDPKHWFLKDSSDIRSSYFMEEVATEFDVQGLELDWTIVAWDANLRYRNNRWTYKSLKGAKWTEVKKPEDQEYLKNAYRVLLTRARQGMVIYVPQGDDQDNTRLREFYSSTYSYLESLGIAVI